MPPAETHKIGTRIEKRWFLQDVIDHLQDAPKGKRRGGRPIVDAEMIERFNQIICHDLFPDVVSCPYFERVMLIGGVEDCGLTEAQSRKVFGLAVVALSHALAHVLNDPDITFNYPASTLELIKAVDDVSRAAATTQEVTQ